MRAVRQYEFGPAENLLFEEVRDPLPAAGQVRISVAASGVHLIDTAIRSGTGGGPFPLPELPMTPGREVAGTVDALGDRVPRSWLGARVVAHLGQASGGYAELAVADLASVHTLPENVSPGSAVAMIGTGRTAVGLLDVAELTADDVVLVTAAAGGIGSLLVREGRNLGATVVGLAGGKAKAGLVRELGADIAVDYTDPGWPTLVRSELGERAVTVLLDGVGGEPAGHALQLLGPGGRVLLFGWSAGYAAPVTGELLMSRGLSAVSPLGPRLWQRAGSLRALEEKSLRALTTGRLTPLVGEPFALAEAATAHRALESRRTTGKVTLKP
ncbi:oxidoreductase [Amycolatopsis antarctica]|uniref:Oxidoreductase n=1 Tax=Amycolatopsis antarctica TaxID=1854586 RepID=A0A263CW61_9PSEU|nr:zinc-binding dehydrogenase [Amycolatopsis antarctica]OZM70331.1 oxidoreductase [Amycolatopsis antarctica]